MLLELVIKHTHRRRQHCVQPARCHQWQCGSVQLSGSVQSIAGMCMVHLSSYFFGHVSPLFTHNSSLRRGRRQPKSPAAPSQISNEMVTVKASLHTRAIFVYSRPAHPAECLSCGAAPILHPGPCYTWGTHTAPPATSPHTSCGKRVGTAGFPVRPSP